MTAKLVMPRAKMKEVLRLMQSVIEKRVTIPILAQIKIQVNPSGVTFTGTNMDTWPEIHFPTGEIPTEGVAVFMLNFSAFRRIASINADKVFFELITERTGSKVVVKAGVVTITYNHLLPPMDFPDSGEHVFQNADVFRATIPAKELHRMMAQARHCVSDEETRYYLNGIFFTRHPENNTLRLVATDGHRLALIDSAVSWPGHSKIVPKSLIDTLLILLGSHEDEDVHIQTLTAEAGPGAFRILFTVGNVSINATVIDGTYPDYCRVVPPVSDACAVDLSQNDIRALTAVFGDRESKICVFDPTDNTMAIRDRGDGEASAVVSVPVTGPTSFGYNAKYLRQQARVTPLFKLRAHSGNDPARITGEDPNALFVLMPMRV